MYDIITHACSDMPDYFEGKYHNLVYWNVANYIWMIMLKISPDNMPENDEGNNHNFT